MSADPRVPTDPTLISSGYIVKQPLYLQDNQSSQLFPGFNTKAHKYEANQHDVPPLNRNLKSSHVCAELNKKLIKCSDNCPKEMMLAGRSAYCHAERKELQTCFTKYGKT